MRRRRDGFLKASSRDWRSMFTTITCISSSIFCRGGVSEAFLLGAQPSSTRGEGALHRPTPCVRWRVLDLLPMCPDKPVTHVPGLNLISLAPRGCIAWGHHLHLFGDMVYNSGL